jgi:hypothetical protein
MNGPIKDHMSVVGDRMTGGIPRDKALKVSKNAAVVGSSSKTAPKVVKKALSTDKSSRRITKKQTPTNFALGLVVGVDGTRMTGLQISQNLGFSRSKGYRLKRMAARFPSHRLVPARLPLIHKQKDVLDVVRSISEHVCSFPYPSIVAQFEANGIADVTESISADRNHAAHNRGKRSDYMWNTYETGFFGAYGPLNTLICIIYDAKSLVNLVDGIRKATNEYLSHLLVVKMSGVFVVLMTDIRVTKKRPVDWLLRVGDYTSAFMWVNLKDAFWLRHTRKVEPSSMHGGGAVDGTKRQKSMKGVLPKVVVWQKISDSTIAGVQLLSYIWKRVETMLSSGGTVLAVGECVPSSSKIHIHVTPYVDASPSDKVGCVGIKEAGKSLLIKVCENWYEDVEKFLTETTVAKKKGFGKKGLVSNVHGKKEASVHGSSNIVSGKGASDVVPPMKSAGVVDDGKATGVAHTGKALGPISLKKSSSVKHAEKPSGVGSIEKYFGSAKTGSSSSVVRTGESSSGKPLVEPSSVVFADGVSVLFPVVESPVIVHTGDCLSVVSAAEISAVKSPAEITGADSAKPRDIDEYVNGEVSTRVGCPSGFDPLVGNVPSLTIDCGDHAEDGNSVAHSEYLPPSEDTTESGFTSQYAYGPCSRAENNVGSPRPVVTGYCTIFKSRMNP